MVRECLCGVAQEGRDRRVAGTPVPRQSFQYPDVRTLPPVGKGVDVKPRRDVHSRRIGRPTVRTESDQVGQVVERGCVFVRDEFEAGGDARRAPVSLRHEKLDDTRFRCLIPDVWYEKVLARGAVGTGTVQIAVGIDGAGKRHLLAVELVEKARGNSWMAFLTGLKERGLQGVEYDVSNSHEGLKCAIEKLLTEALWQRYTVLFLRNPMVRFSERKPRA